MAEKDGFAYSGTQLLSDIELNLKRYSFFVFSKISKPFLLNSFQDGFVLDFGAGTGTMARLWRAHLGVSPLCVEIDNQLASNLRQAGFETHDKLADLSKKFQFVYSANVLEHIEEDVVALVQLGKVLEINGLLCVYVPAFPILFSDLDRQVGHYRRYTKETLNLALTSSGYEIVKSEYCDSLGFIATLILKSLNFSFGGATKSSKILMKVYDSCVFPVSVMLDRIGLRNFFGKNLFVLAKLKSLPEDLV
jgi:SAM-dependent methyltransferase